MWDVYERGFPSSTNGIYFVDGNLGDAFGEDFTASGSLAGIRGTAPMAEASSNLIARMRVIDPSVDYYDWAPEAYDAVVLTALATIIAGTDDPAAVAREINGVTRDGERCDNVASRIELIEAGADIDHIGAAGPLSFSQPGEPTGAFFAIWEYGADNRIDGSLRTFHFTSSI